VIRSYETASGRLDFCNGDPVNGFDPDGRDVAWGQVIKGTIGAVANGALAVSGAALSEFGVGVPIALYGSYQFGANVGNIINGFRGAGEGPTGPVQTVAQVGMLAGDVDPNSMAWKRVDIAAETVDVLVPTILAGQIDTRLIAGPAGEAGTLLGSCEKYYISAEEAFPTLNLAIRGDQLLTAADYVKYGIEEYKNTNTPETKKGCGN
jgi:hypothetical protein